MDYQTLSLVADGRGVLTLTLERPEKRNALSSLMIAELSHALDAATQHGGARVLVLTGRGVAFCAGGDLDWMRQQFSATRAERMDEARKLATLLRQLNELPLPVIARVAGDAYGGGVGLLCTADVVVASDQARFGLTETRLGLIPATIGPYVIARLGEGVARRVFMSGRIFAADEAVRLGVVSRLCPIGDLDAAVESEIVPCLAAAPGAVAAAKALARSLGPVIDEAVIEHTIGQLADIWETDHAREGVGAFFERRPPSWIKAGEP